MRQTLERTRGTDAGADSSLLHTSGRSASKVGLSVMGQRVFFSAKNHRTRPQDRFRQGVEFLDVDPGRQVAWCVSNRRRVDKRLLWKAKLYLNLRIDYSYS